MNKDLMFSTGNGEHETPKELIDDLATVFKWDADVCATWNNVCDTYYTTEEDALTLNWPGKLNWMNPPYGRGIRKWMDHAAHQSMHGVTVVSLVPARTDTAWWHEAIEIASHITLIKGRLKFGTDSYWVKEFSGRIMRESATPKQLNVLIRKLGGGAVCIDPTYRQKIADMWMQINEYKPLPFTLQEWYERTNVNKDSAPFPSAFVVFGKINLDQTLKLWEYGWTPVNQLPTLGEKASSSKIVSVIRKLYETVYPS